MVPHLTRSNLHLRLQRHGISRLPGVIGDKPARKPFKSYPIGYLPYRHGWVQDTGKQVLPERGDRLNLESGIRTVG